MHMVILKYKFLHKSIWLLPFYTNPDVIFIQDEINDALKDVLTLFTQVCLDA